jgi:hypothetical protein
VNLNPWLSNIKYYGDAQKYELTLHAILNPSRDKRDQLHDLAAVLSKKVPLHYESDGPGTKSGWGAEGSNS